MSIFKYLTSFDLSRGVRAFLRLEAELVCGEPRDLDTLVRDRERQIDDLQKQLAESEGKSTLTRSGRSTEESVEPENLVWIFGSGRSGTSWLNAMLKDALGCSAWFEPRLGDVFDAGWPGRFGGERFVFSDSYRKTWLGSIRGFVLDGANARYPEAAGPGKHLIIKETSGCVGAPMLMEALPESCMILLLRDPRDVVASWLDGLKEGGWRARQKKRHPQEDSTDHDSEEMVTSLARRYLKNMESAARAYDSHRGLKALVHYEELNPDPFGVMQRLLSELELSVGEEELTWAVEEHSWKNVPEGKRGEGKFYRKALPGSWKEDLTSRQVDMVKEITAPVLDKFYGE